MYVQIEEPWTEGTSNKRIQKLQTYTDLSPSESELVSQYQSRVNDQLPLCPTDGNPDCRNCSPGRPGDNLVMTQCCFAHHWAWKEGRNLRDVIPYHFHLEPRTDMTIEPDNLESDTPGGTWEKDPCTGEPATSVPNGPYIPWSKRK
ncbi:uncharacterized protein LOC129596925 [Paramacrobiotus metropolitanus]|uniref:uncharacterized protein LOC129596925 n=1 Tax=Paramacrobiotus metropolitanus TaxID=2943436 RepID=UPI0024462A7B|nr:uncharacterized protein LOC129596925 [Paramacrobiotus metropolitanus]